MVVKCYSFRNFDQNSLPQCIDRLRRGKEIQCSADALGFESRADDDFPPFSITFPSFFHHFPPFSIIFPLFPSFSTIFHCFPPFSTVFHHFPLFSTIFHCFPPFSNVFFNDSLDSPSETSTVPLATPSNRPMGDARCCGPIMDDMIIPKSPMVVSQ